jgi:hypothetical protein
VEEIFFGEPYSHPNFPIYVCEGLEKMSKEVWKKRKNIFVLGFFGSKKMWRFMDITPLHFMHVFFMFP